MLRVARLYVRSFAVAEEVVQETWLRALRSLDRFEGRSSLRTWLFVILANCGRRRAEREGRYVAVGDLEPDEAGDVPAVAASSFFPRSHPRWAGMWSTRVGSWDAIPDDRLVAGEGREQLRQALASLPPRYAVVFVLRDVEGWSGGEVCDLLDISAANQRVLLHRARTRIRAAIARYFEGETA